MKKLSEKELNISIFCLNYNFGAKVARLLAGELDMYFLDTYELYCFDIKPMTFSEILEHYGLRYFREKQKGTVKYVSTFENTCMVIESGASIYKGNIEYLDKTSLTIFIDLTDKEIDKLELKDVYNRKLEKSFFHINKESRRTRKEKLKKMCDITLNSKKAEEIAVTKDLINAIKSYYNIGE